MTLLRSGFLAAILLAATSVVAHEERLHGANAFIGEVASVEANGFQLKTKNGMVKVNYSSKTKFEAGKKAADKAEVKAGLKIGVAGTKLPSGEVMANLVLIGYVPEADSAHDKPKPTEHKH
jgi:hypothetical protein